MKRQAFTLTELLVGLLISVFIVAAMGSFLGELSYGFHGHKALLQDRSQLQRSMAALSRDLMEVGYLAGEDGQLEVDGESQYYLTLGGDGQGDLLSSSIRYYRSGDTMDVMASQREDLNYQWQQVGYAVNRSAVDPLTQTTVPILTRNGEPFVVDVTEFTVALGADLDGDQLISDDEWLAEEPLEDEADDVYGNLLKLRLTLGKKTRNADGTESESRLVREIYLRNRGHL